MYLIKFYNDLIKIFIKLGIERKVFNLISRILSSKGFLGRFFKGS